MNHTGGAHSRAHSAHDARNEAAAAALFEQRYRAIDARDARFDGQFYTVVKSTKIYCRPSCPARTPKRENVSFVLTSAAAHEAGYRACKRCLPEAAPGTPEWNLRQDVAARAMRLIADGIVDRDGTGGLAAALALSPRHLTRLLTAELGAGPLALARARRAQLARSLVTTTELPLVDVAFAAGFGSVRQFNDTVREVFAASPSELREQAAGRARSAVGGAHAAASAVAATTATATVAGASSAAAAAAATPATAEPPAVQLTLSLPVRQPFDAPGLVAFLAARAIPGVERVDGLDAHDAHETDETNGDTASARAHAPLRYARTLSLPGGAGAVELTFTTNTQGHWTVAAELEAAVLGDVPAAVARVRRLLDLDADAAGIDTALSRDPQLAPLVAKTPGIRVPGAVDPHELVVRAIVGQQITVVAARGHLTRLVERAGAQTASRFDGLTTLFPGPDAIAKAVPLIGQDDELDPDRTLRLPRRQSNAVATAASRLASGELAVHVGADADELRDALTALPGVGRWTAAYIALRVLGDTDAWLTGDVALIAGARTIGALPYPRPTDKKLLAAEHQLLEAHAARWSPWRSYASMHLWQAAAPANSHTNTPRKARQ